MAPNQRFSRSLEYPTLKYVYVLRATATETPSGRYDTTLSIRAIDRSVQWMNPPPPPVDDQVVENIPSLYEVGVRVTAIARRMKRLVDSGYADYLPCEMTIDYALHDKEGTYDAKEVANG